MSLVYPSDTNGNDKEQDAPNADTDSTARPCDPAKPVKPGAELRDEIRGLSTRAYQQDHRQERRKHTWRGSEEITSASLSSLGILNPSNEIATLLVASEQFAVVNKVPVGDKRCAIPSDEISALLLASGQSRTEGEVDFLLCLITSIILVPVQSGSHSNAASAPFR